MLQSRWELISHEYSNKVSRGLKGKGRRLLEEVMLQYIYPRLDVNVSTGKSLVCAGHFKARKHACSACRHRPHFVDREGLKVHYGYVTFVRLTEIEPNVFKVLCLRPIFNHIFILTVELFSTM